MGQFFFVQIVIITMNTSTKSAPFYILLVILFNLSIPLFAQTSVDVESPSFNEAPSQTKEFKLFQKDNGKKFTYDIYYDQLIVEYQDRMIANVKKYQKLAKEMKKPQYSEHAYFGHKRLPKKRRLGKRKFCKECEIVH